VSSYERIYRAVKKVPRGKVTTYGAIARMAGLPRQARLVGYALSALHGGSTLPWHRVINAQGRLSLEREGVRVDAAGRVSLKRFGWGLGRTGDRPLPRTKSR